MVGSELVDELPLVTVKNLKINLIVYPAAECKTDIKDSITDMGERAVLDGCKMPAGLILCKFTCT